MSGDKHEFSDIEKPPVFGTESENLLGISILRPSLLWAPDWSASGQHLEIVPFTFWIVDLLRPRNIVVMGEGMRGVFYAACQTVERLQIPARVRLYTPLSDAPAFSEAERTRHERWRNFSDVISGDMKAALTAMELDRVDFLCLGRTETDEMDDETSSILRGAVAAPGVILLEDPRKASALLDRPVRLLSRFELDLGKGPMLVSIGTAGDQNTAADRALAQLEDESDLAFLLRGLMTRLGSGLRDAFEARAGWRTARRYEADLARLAGALDLARSDVSAMRSAVEEGRLLRDAVAALEGKLAESSADAQSVRLELGESSAEVARLHADAQSVRLKLGESLAEIAQLRAEAKFHQEAFAESRTEISKLLGQNLADQQMLIRQRSELDGRDRDVEALQMEFAQVRGELLKVYESTSWRLTWPIRSVLGQHVRSARLLRRATKLLWWTATLQLRRRYKGRMLARFVDGQGVPAAGPAPNFLVPPGFDEHAYLAAHADVREAVSAGAFVSGLAHYLLAGRNEGRALAASAVPAEDIPPDFDEHAYLAAHDDVREAVSAGALASGLAHYLSAGRSEGRALNPSALFRKRFDTIHAELNSLTSQLNFERSRTDWALGAVEGVTRNIEAYHDLRRQPEYLAAFQKPKPLVSICVATMNRSALLMERTIRSLRAQTYQNLQIVVVGDHCIDDTAQRLAQIRDSRILFANLPERGPYPPPGIDRWRVAGSMAMNHALSLCEGDFVTHLDDDDTFTADRIETLLSAAREHCADFLWHSFWYENRDGTWQRLGNGQFELGQITTGSLFYHRYFARYPWDVHAYRLNEPGDWNRLRKIKLLRPRFHFVDRPMLFHYAEQSQPIFTAYDAERFVD